MAALCVLAEVPLQRRKLGQPPRIIDTEIWLAVARVLRPQRPRGPLR